jgi:hypothetical protein
MQLRSPDGTSVDLRIAGYEFLDHQARVRGSPEGAPVDLGIAGYEFPPYQSRVQDSARNWLEIWAEAGPPPGGRWARDSDANWLQVRGNITLADGTAWAFERPCLTTWEARGLGSWLRAVAAGTVPPSPVAGGEPEGRLEFFEPDIAFSVAERTADRVRIRVHFNVDSLPPWLQGTEVEPGLYEYFVRLEVSAEELTRAAESWMLELAEFPER